MDNIRTKWDDLFLKRGKHDLIMRAVCAVIVFFSTYRMLRFYGGLGEMPLPQLAAGQMSVLIPLGCAALTMVSAKLGAGLVGILVFIVFNGASPIIIGVAAVLMTLEAFVSGTMNCIVLSMMPLCMMTSTPPDGSAPSNFAYLMFAVIIYCGYKMTNGSKYTTVFEYSCLGIAVQMYTLKDQVISIWSQTWKAGAIAGADFESDLARFSDILIMIIIVVAANVIISVIAGRLLISDNRNITKIALDIREGIAFVIIGILMTAGFFILGMVDGITVHFSIPRLLIQMVLAYIVTRPIASYKIAKALSQQDYELQDNQKVVSTGDVVRSTGAELTSLTYALDNDKEYDRILFTGQRPVKAVLIYGNPEMNKKYILENNASGIGQKIEYLESTDLIRQMADAGDIEWKPEKGKSMIWFFNHFDRLYESDAGKKTAAKIMEYVDQCQEDKDQMFIFAADDPQMIPDDCYGPARISRVLHANISDSVIFNDSYAILDVIGKGGFGEVFSAWHTRLNEKVVLKKVASDQSSSVSGKHEVELLKRVKHMYLPKIYDVFDTNHALYLVTDFVPGRSFADYLKEGRKFDQKYVLIWAKQLADAVGYLHNMQPPIIHSDIKPGNIMLTPEGDICLIDFNISAILDKNTARSVGTTPGYSPIEQYGFVKNYLNLLSKKGVDVEAFSKAKVGAGYLSSKLSESLSNSLANSASSALPEDSRPYGEPDDMDDETAAADWEDATVASGWDDDETMAADNETRYLDENEPVSEPLITPEQMSLVVDNKSFLVDCIQKGYGVRSDIYAIGATLYHLLTGVKPSINFFGIRPIHEFRDVVSPEFAAVIETCMRIDPDERYTDIDELKTALDNVYI